MRDRNSTAGVLASVLWTTRNQGLWQVVIYGMPFANWALNNSSLLLSVDSERTGGTASAILRACEGGRLS